MRDDDRCSKCGADVEETYTARICQGCYRLRFLKYVVKERNGCWEWSGFRDRAGYGHFKFNGKMPGAHRVSYVLFNGPIVKSLHVLHQCDNPPCVNPAHLFLGTPSDNALDSVRKGRWASKSGFRNGRARLTIQKAKEIELAYNPRNGMSAPKVAAKFSISASHVYNILHGRHWSKKA